MNISLIEEFLSPTGGKSSIGARLPTRVSEAAAQMNTDEIGHGKMGQFLFAESAILNEKTHSWAVPVIISFLDRALYSVIPAFESLSQTIMSPLA